MTHPAADTIAVEALLDVPASEMGPRVDAILGSLFQKKANHKPFKRFEPRPYWSAEFYGLCNVRLFQKSTEAEKYEILLRCASHILEEAYFIEKLGLTFNAKMILLSRTVQERMIYSYFAAEEAAHFQIISCYAKGGDPYHRQPFLKILRETVETASKGALVYLIQIVLEGWGLSHYRAVADACRDEKLKNQLRQILTDEAVHHGSGVALFNPEELSKADHEFVREVIVRLFQTIQCGPQYIAASLEAVKGPLTIRQRTKLFRELDSESHVRERGQLICGLLGKASGFDVLPLLNQYDLLRPFSAEQCSHVIESSDTISE